MKLKLNHKRNELAFVFESQTARVLYIVDRSSRYKFFLITNLTHSFMCLFILSLYMFPASQRSSSGDRIVLIHWYAGQEGTAVPS